MLNSTIFNLKKNQKSFLLLNSPHSGRNYSDFIQFYPRLSLNELRKSEDTYIDLLFESKLLNVNSLVATFPRIFVDLNRSPLELDTSMWIGKFNKLGR